MIHRARIKNRSRLNEDRSWLVNDWLMHDNWLGMDHGLCWNLVNDHVLHRRRLVDYSLNRLMNHYGSRVHVDRWGGINRLGLENFREEEPRSHASQHFPGCSPLSIPCAGLGDCGPENSRCT